MMSINTHKIVLVWVAICFLVPSGVKVAGVTILDFLIFSIVTLSFLVFLNEGRRRQVLTGVERALLFFLLIAVVSCAYNSLSPFSEQEIFVSSLGLSTDFLFARLTVYGVMTIVMLFGGYHIVSTTIKTRQDIVGVIKVFIWSGMVNALITIAFWAATTGGTFERYNYVPPIEGSQGIHLNYMSMVFLVSFAVMISGDISKRQRLFLVSVMSLTGFSMLTVMVRQGWIMFLLSVMIFFYLFRRKSSADKKRGMNFLPVMLISLCVLFLVIKNQTLLVELFTDVFSITGTDTDQGSWLMRFALIQHGLNIFMANPLLGIGFGHYPAYSTVPIFVTRVETFVSSPHNGVVTIAAETGILGLIGLGLISFHLLRESYIAYKNSSCGYVNAIVAAVLALLIITAASQFISNSLIVPLPTERSMTQNSFLLWILFGLVAGIRKNLTHSRHIV